MKPRLREHYEQKVIPALMKEFGYRNRLQVPRIRKITLNMGLGEAIQNAKVLELAVDELSLIAGQKAVITRARRSIAGFKLREGMAIGCKVTLRSARMYEFLDRLINVALPRVRDFRGLADRGFDGRGNYALGIEEQVIFPEIDYDKVDKIRGLSVVVTTSAQTDEESKALLRAFGMPFRK